MHDSLFQSWSADTNSCIGKKDENIGPRKMGCPHSVLVSSSSEDGSDSIPELLVVKSNNSEQSESTSGIEVRGIEWYCLLVVFRDFGEKLMENL